MHSNKPILHIEDDEIDAMAVERVVKILNLPNKLIRRENGEEALKYLTGKNNEKPAVILLDVNMPLMDGKELLEIVRKDSNLNKIPVIILATSDRDRDLTGSNVVGCILKSLDFDKFAISIKSEFEKLDSCCPIA